MKKGPKLISNHRKLTDTDQNCLKLQNAYNMDANSDIQISITMKKTKQYNRLLQKRARRTIQIFSSNLR